MVPMCLPTLAMERFVQELNSILQDRIRWLSDVQIYNFFHVTLTRVCAHTHTHMHIYIYTTKKIVLSQRFFPGIFTNRRNR